MNISTKSAYGAERRARSLGDKVVSSMEGVLFASLSTLLVLAIATAVLEDFGPTGAAVEATASAPAGKVVRTAQLAESAVVADAASVK